MKKTLASLLTTGIIFMSATAAHAANLVYNGDFELGNTGFNSQYNMTALWLEGAYNILNNPYPAHSNATSYGDHTTGSGLMMAVNGSVNSNYTVWSQSVNVTPGQDYNFSAWVSSWTSGNAANLNFLINGQSIGTFTANTQTALWEEFSQNWNSGSASIADIKIIDLTTAAGGNDFALDDISLTPAPEPSSLLLSLLGISGAIRLRRNKK